jgi:hypothetical protein
MGNNLTQPSTSSNLLIFGCNEKNYFQELKNKFSDAKVQSIQYREEVIQNSRFICQHMVDNYLPNTFFLKGEPKLLQDTKNTKIILEIWKNKRMKDEFEENLLREIPFLFK